MKIEQVASQHAVQQTAVNQAAQADARTRAIAKITGATVSSSQANPAQSQELPVQNATRVSPEEMSATRTSTQGQLNGEEASTQAAATEATPTAAAAKDKELLSTQYAQLARREKAIYAKAQQRDRAIAEREAAVQARETAIQAKDSEYQSNFIPKQRLAEDTINVLLENGLSYDQITQLALNHSAQDPATKLAIQKLEQQVKAERDARVANEKASQQAQDAQYQAALKQIRSDAKQLVMQDPSFEAIRKTNSIRDVVELIEETFKEDGIVLSVEEACREVEDHLVEKLSTYSSQIGKIQQRMKANSPSSQQTGNTQQPHQPKPTLTNAVGTGKKLNARERALLAFEGKLQK